MERLIPKDVIGSAERAYLIGIAGVGMSALARVLYHGGMRVSGSDLIESGTTRDLTRSGIPVFIGQREACFGESDLIIYSSAIPRDHVEMRAARQAGIRVCHRAEVLSSLLNRAATSVAVCGTHGKTTTTSMISYVLSEAGRNPTCLVGGDVLNLGTNAILGESKLWISEVDESDRSHMLYSPNYVVLTNLEEDHLDNYADLEDLKMTFRHFIGNAHNPGLIIYNNDDPVLRELVLESGKPRMSFGMTPTADFAAKDIKMTAGGVEFDMCEAGFFATRLRLAVPGKHNVANALAATALLTALGIDADSLETAMARFRGVRRRLEVKWSSDELVVIDDYAHHPTEVEASLAALRSMRRPLTVIFQPHRYSRTRAFLKEFAVALELADNIIVTDIYGAGEINVHGVHSELIVEEIARRGFTKARFVSRADIPSFLESHGEFNGVIAFIGAGNIGECADEFASRIQLTTA
ncbi:MAG: UDP-N-acetylmuramate--L-alanine ligase [Candidatus Omnitrophota bacterium]|nr:UDP-N-acetylmuramate--L-alanine ligase [Candidatus Omnitrophota bacterium]